MKTIALNTESLPLPVSVVIPTFNRANWLARSVTSVLKQSHPVREIIVIDDGSTDNTQEVVASLIQLNKSSTKIIYYFRENSGVSKSRNFGIERASHDWIAFLDSDDEWYKKKMELQWRHIQENPECKIVHGNEKWYRDGLFVNQKKRHRKSGGRIYERCLELCLISPSAVMLHKDVFTRVGHFREDFPVCEDYDLWLKITAEFDIGFVEEAILRKNGGHEDQLSQRYAAMDHWRVLSMLNMLEHPSLNEKEIEETKLMIERKTKVLAQGYRRRNKLKELSEIQQRLREHAEGPYLH